MDDDPEILDLEALKEQLDDELTATFVTEAIAESLKALLEADGPYNQKARHEVWLQVGSLNEVGRVLTAVIALDYLALTLRRLGWGLPQLNRLVKERMEGRDAAG